MSIKHEKKFQKLVKEIFPYSSFRPFQLDAIKFAFNIFRKRKIGLLSSPCGTGKSVSILTAYFAAKELDDAVGRLLVLTRTRNQLEIYCRELKNIKEHSHVKLVASVFKSKKEMCPYAMEEPKLREVSYRDFLYYCKGLKQGMFGKTCKYYEKTYSGRKPSWHTYTTINKIKDIGPLMPSEVYEICRKSEICPYEATKILARHADIIIGNYNYILVSAIRGSILGRAGIKTEELNCVFDEAHSLPYYAAGILSDELSSTSVRRALREVERFGLDDFGVLETFYNVMVRLGRNVYKKYGSEAEHLIQKDVLVNKLSKKLQTKADKLQHVFSELSDLGETIRQKRVEEGKSPISYLSRCANFLLDWLSVENSSYVHYIRVETDRFGRKSVRLGIRCLDPALATKIVNDLRSVILMSGTLWHTSYYMDVLGMEKKRCESLELPNPFPPENRIILVDRAVTTKFEKRSEEQWRKIAERLSKIIQQISGRVAVYFPSYEVMHKVLEIAKFNFPLLVEERRTKISDVLKFFKTNENCVVCGVARGKISEGVDMTDEGKSLLSSVIIVGLPYPRKTELQEALYKYFKDKFGEKAREYSNGIPCLNALAQSAGRLIRSEEDRGIIVVMDARAAGRFKWKFPADWRNCMEVYMNLDKIIGRIADFTDRRWD